MDWRRYRVAQEDFEHEQIGRLRRHAYVAAGKVPTSNEPFIDTLDREPHVRVLYLESARARPIATARLAMPSGDHERVDHDDYFVWPNDFPPKRLSGEVSRVAVEPSHERRGLMRAMVMGVGLELLRHGRRYLVGSATGSLLRYYTALGGRVMPVEYRHIALGNMPHRAFVVDVLGVVSRQVRVGPLVWSTVIAPLCRAALADRLLGLDRFGRARLQVVAAAGSVGGLVVRHAARASER